MSTFSFSFSLYVNELNGVQLCVPNAAYMCIEQGSTPVVNKSKREAVLRTWCGKVLKIFGLKSNR